MKPTPVQIWQATAGPRGDLLAVCLVGTHPSPHCCALTCGGRIVSTGPEAEPLIEYAQAEFEAVGGVYAD